MHDVRKEMKDISQIERYINSPEALHNPPDYTDILKVVQRANERYKLMLTRNKMTQIAQEAFRETGNKLQERRQLDMVYNFGSHLTDSFKPTLDPALTDPALNRKLRSNRDVALSSLEEVITKYSNKQEDIEVEEMRKKQERDRQKKEFVDHCSKYSQDHPEVVTYLQTRYSKALPTFLTSVEFRNTLGRCLTRAQANTGKTFVYINELCTVLKQHTARKRSSLQSVPSQTKPEQKSNGTNLKEEEQVKEEEEKQEAGEETKKTKRASRRQIAYLENLLKVYNEEIRRLQERELSIDDLEKEDSSYIQEHKLKRKMMKIYDKLCELKGCNTLTGRVIEQKIPYSGTRYPEINKKVLLLLVKSCSSRLVL
ncbi:death domain-associated protein 6-like [Sinocyclocheilus grahami]|uniref:death domain-associated protein 6-like n=1 Tax=Sinocyclocheilus grahami TaxID=75366 RepID=UPI0007AD1012|nr:PREDICTED: death domain-associated protein 6-like [Sinocyclocheilus grahami]